MTEGLGIGDWGSESDDLNALIPDSLIPNP